MRINDTTLCKILLDGSYVTEDDIASAQQYAQDHQGSVMDYLLSEGLVSNSLIGQAVAEYYRVPYSDLNTQQPSREQVLLIPEDMARKFRAVVFKQKKSEIVIATDNPADGEMLAALTPLFAGRKIKVTYSRPEDIDAAFSHYQGKLETKFDQIIASQGKSVPEIVDRIIDDALALRASDIHIEPQDRKADIRFRIDGVLHDAGQIPKAYYENVVNRLKVQAKLRIDEHFSPQDGAIRYVSQYAVHPVDLRVSIVPTLEGEKIAIRILSSYIRDITLADVGFSAALQEQVMRSTKKPFGMILVTGPTGSGKTTTLYALLKQLNTRRINITTIEDPVEYKIEGINQIQTNPQTGLTFARGLRAIARQDPNIILVGEIRDLETADIAVNAALTGHMLFSTFHANNAATAIPRFIDMGVEPFLVSSTLELVISQRLVRKICSSCKMSYTLSKSDMNKFGPEVAKYFDGRSQTLYKGKGCDACAHTGYGGRMGVFEFITTSPDLQDIIAKSPSTKEVADLIRKQGFHTMFEDGIEKVKNGVTTIEELLRVVAP